MTELLHSELTGSIIGVYYDVYNGTSRIYPERFYDRAMVHDLNALGVRCVQQPQYEIVYKERIVGKQILDILVAEDVVVEDKVAQGLMRLHKAQLLSYLKVTGKQIGLLLNFGGAKPEFQRLYFATREPKIAGMHIEPAIDADERADLVAPELVYQIVGALFEVHATLGPGFIHRIYANACRHELGLRGLEVKAQKAIEVFYRDISLGHLKFDHLRVDDTVIVFPTAIQNIADIRPGNIREWLQVQQIPLGILANFYDTELKPIFLKP